MQNALTFVAEQTQACLYNFRGGVKTYLVFSRAVRTESLTGGLFKGITRAIQGSDDERIAKELQWGIDEIRKVIPQVLVERIDIPGRPAVEPDKAAVAAIIPSAAAVVETVAAPAALPAPTGAVAPVAMPAANAQQAKVAARKDLTGMGLSFHSQEQFFQAIRRKDDVAVSLFVAGGGVDPQAPDASGMTALALAESLGATEIAALLKPAAPAVAAVPAAAVATPIQSNTPSAEAVAEAVKALPSEMKAQIDEVLESMHLPPAEKEAERARAYVKFGTFARSVDNAKAMAKP